MLLLSRGLLNWNWLQLGTPPHSWKRECGQKHITEDMYPGGPMWRYQCFHWLVSFQGLSDSHWRYQITLKFFLCQMRGSDWMSTMVYRKKVPVKKVPSWVWYLFLWKNYHIGTFSYWYLFLSIIGKSTIFFIVTDCYQFV